MSDGEAQGERSTGTQEAEPPAVEGFAPSAAQAEVGDSPIVDPLLAGRATEADVLVLESFAARAGILAKLSLAAGACSALVTAVAFTGRVDVGVLLYVLPVGAAHVALGVFLRRAAVSLTDAARARWANRGSLVAGLRELHKALGAQLFATGFLVFLMLVALWIAAAFQRATEI